MVTIGRAVTVREARIRAGPRSRHPPIARSRGQSCHVSRWRGRKASKAGERRTSGCQVELREIIAVSSGSNVDVGGQRLSKGSGRELFPSDWVVRPPVKIA